MSEQNSTFKEAQKDFVETDVLRKIRRHRLMQICAATALGLLASLLVARGVTFWIFAAGLSFLVLAFGLAYKNFTLSSASVLLASMSLMLFSFALTGAGLFDLAILGYPGLLIFSAILGGVVLFLSMLSVIILQCLALTYMTMEAIITPNVPVLSWIHLTFILVIFIVIGFSVYILVNDIKRLMRWLQTENHKVEESRNQIQHLAHHDSLTGLPNRSYGQILFEQSLAASQSKNVNLGILFIDLDNFKPVNDALGHEAGDTLLVKLSKRLREMLANTQHLVRFGGDEFLIISPYEDKSELELLAVTVINECTKGFEVKQTRLVLSASIGIASSPEHGDDFKQLCRKADIAMYRAKKDGRSTFHFYEESLEQASDDKFSLLQQIRPAVKNQGFELYYQPIIDMTNAKVISVEALLRWPQADGSFIPPDKFIPLAETCGAINNLGKWVIEEACRYCASMRASGFTDLRVSVNLSVMQFKDGQLNRIVQEALAQSGLLGEALEFELTESLLIDETEQIQKQLHMLTMQGCTIAIDDFGTGYSNLAYLREFKASRLKIDRSFVTNICTSHDNELLVSAIIELAKNLGLEVVAEGIEDAETLAKLQSLSCKKGQGYLWSKPLPAKDLPTFLNKYLPH
ncbi:MAG: EAL domain-containing protein [Glaciecola sp.]|jgi:diguanylate cyclase (GGDEF)-like protein